MKTKEVVCWGMYDLANTIFSALFVTFFYPFYIKEFLGGNELQIGLVFGLSMLIVGIAVPILGAWSDLLGRRMPFIVISTIACCMFTALVAFSSLPLALLFGFLANFAYHAALAAYNALLPGLGSKKELGKVSGIGTAMGYLGTLLALGIAAIILSNLGWETQLGAEVIIVATSAMFLVFSLPTFLGIKENYRRVRDHLRIRQSAKNVITTIKSILGHRSFLHFLLAMFFITNAINAVIVFLFLFAKQQINLSVQAFFVVYAIQSLGAVVGSYISGKLTDRIGATSVLMAAGIAWMAVIVFLFFVTSTTMFVLAGMLGGAALGAVWTAQRPKLLELSAKEHVGQNFGFLELTGKFSGILGPIIFGLLAYAFSYQHALISLIAFFALGLYFLGKVES